jgi:hypothetical protein
MPETPYGQETAPPGAFPGGAADPVHPSVRRERTDADIRGVLLFGAVLVMIGIVVHVLVFGLFLGDVRSERKKSPKVPEVARKLPRFPQDIPDIPPPRLQIADAHDMDELRAREDRELNAGPEWVDRKRAVVRIPIDDAVRRLSLEPEVAARNGLRTRSEKEGKKK